MKKTVLALILMTRWIDAGQIPAPIGKMVNLGGRRLHVHCAGQGTPVVVIENGLGDFSFDWTLVQERVARFTRVCAYDRGGYAWSDPGPKPRTYAQLNLELRDALAKLGEHGPYVMVGHSFGGPVVRNFATTYPRDVAGMVLVDTVHEDQRIPMGPHAGRIRDDARGRPVPAPRENMLASDAAPHGDSHPEPLEAVYNALPDWAKKLHVWAQALPALEDAEASQREWSAEYMAKMHATPQDGILGDLPLVVLTRAEGGYDDSLDVPGAELERERKETQAKLVRLSRRGRQVIVKSGHNMHLEAPDAVAGAIRDVVEAARGDRRRN